MGSISLRDGEKARQEITKRQQKEILRLYNRVYKDLKKKLDSLPSEGSTNSLRRAQLDRLTKELKKAYEELGVKLRGQIESDIQGVSEAVVEDIRKWLQSAGISAEGAYAYVPTDIVELLSSGKLYGKGWTLSKAIWGDSQDKAKDIDKVVAEGLAANKSAYDIAKDLEKYVNPSAKKDWEWSKVYPGTSKRVDYNAQRLARTMSAHAYQQSMLATTKDNPFVKGYRWKSGHTSRTCDLCNERDGKVYTAENIPMDHPNGTCTFIVETPSMMDVSDQLAAWAKGESNPKLDRWFKGMSPETPPTVATPPAPKKRSTSKKTSSQRPSPPPTPKEPEVIKSTEWIGKNLSKMKTQITKNFGGGNWSKVQDRLLELDEPQLKWLSQGNDLLKKLYSDKGKGYWRAYEGTLSIDLDSDIKGTAKHPFSTLFHEYGHLMDTKLGKISSSEKEGKDIYNLLQKEYNNLINPRGSLKSNIRWDLIEKDGLTSGVQDIISGLSLDENRVRWGHSKTYWTRKPPEDRWKEVTSEAFAHLNSAYLNPKIKEQFVKYFPETMEYFEKEVIGKYVQ